MKKTFLLLLVVFTTKSFGQDYDITLEYSVSGANCHAGGYSWDFNGIDSFSDAGNSMGGSGTRHYTSSGNNFSLSLSGRCTPIRQNDLDCDDSFSTTKSSRQLIIDNGLGLGTCNGGVSIIKFNPNVTIRNLDNANPSQICSGFQLNLAGFPAGFPNEAYHWQYSLNNQVTWIDLPASFNDRPNNLFTMQELLGSSHEAYYNKQIYFRLGYGQNRPFTAPLAITYSPCAPVITAINYVGPKCAGDPIQKVEVTFDRPLAADEVLDPISMKNASSGAIRNQRTNVSFDADNPLKYTFININDQLENGQIYNIVYQAKKGGIPLGVPISSAQSFTYNEISPLTFSTTASNVTCNGANNGTISISATGGTPPYSYILDGATGIPFVSPANITGLSPITHMIKIIDTNECYEK